ncbi:MAG: magnesium transporter, partial [Planctomycetota bacterium]
MPEKEKIISELYKDLKALLAEENKKAELDSFIHDLHAADLAEILDDLNDEEREIVLNMLDVEERAEVIDEASDNQKEEIFEDITDQELAEIVEIMPPDEAAEALEYVEDERADLVLQKIDDEQAEDIREILEFEEDTAGRIMTTEYLAVEKTLSAGEVLKKAKELTEDTETLHHIMVIDKQERLIADVRMEDLIKAEENTPVTSLMERAVICIHAQRDQEVAARMMEKYDLAVLPVVGDGGRLLGIITFDDILEVMEEEASEDMYRLAGIGSD